MQNDVLTNGGCREMLETSPRRRPWKKSNILSPSGGEQKRPGHETLINAHILDAEKSIQSATLEDAKKYLILCLFFFSFPTRIQNKRHTSNALHFSGLENISFFASWRTHISSPCALKCYFGQDLAREGDIQGRQHGQTDRLTGHRKWNSLLQYYNQTVNRHTI